MEVESKKLAFILGNYFGQCPGGAELQSFYIAREALRCGWEVHYCFMSNDRKFVKKECIALYPIRKRRLWNKLSNIKYPYYFELSDFLRRVKPDAIYQRGALSFTGIAARYAKKNRCRLVYHIASDPDVQVSALPWRRLWLVPELLLLRYGIRHATTIIAQTKTQANVLEKNFDRRAVVIPNGHPDPGECRKPEMPLRVLWIANWKPLKQPELFVQLARELGRRGNVRFMMLGRTGRYEALVEEAKSLGIEVLGEVPNERVNEILCTSHILVNTSLYEGFSNTFIQAWMRKVPVVSLNADPDAVLEGRQLGFRSGSPAQLAIDTERLINDCGLRQRMSVRAREYALHHCSLENMNKIVEIISG